MMFNQYTQKANMKLFYKWRVEVLLFYFIELYIKYRGH